jgi:hypothetical protein
MHALPHAGMGWFLFVPYYPSGNPRLDTIGILVGAGLGGAYFLLLLRRLRSQRDLASVGPTPFIPEAVEVKLPLTIRPRAANGPRWPGCFVWIVSIGAIAYLAVFLALGVVRGTKAVSAWFSMVVIALPLAWRWLYFRFGRVRVDELSVTNVGWSLRPQAVPRSLVTRVALRRIDLWVSPGTDPYAKCSLWGRTGAVS